MKRPCKNPKKIRRRANIENLDKALKYKHVTPGQWASRMNDLTSRTRARQARKVMSAP